MRTGISHIMAAAAMTLSLIIAAPAEAGPTTLEATYTSGIQNGWGGSNVGAIR